MPHRQQVARCPREAVASPGCGTLLARPLRLLAQLYGVQTAYYDVSGRRNTASPEGALRVLAALGAPVAGPGDVRDALRQRLEELARAGPEPVTVVWDGAPGTVEWRSGAAGGCRVACELRLEGGGVRRWSGELQPVAPASGMLAGARAADTARPAGTGFEAYRLSLPPLPYGYHVLMQERAGEHRETLVISAPRRAWTAQRGQRDWGVFLPLHALHSRRSWGAGDLTDLGALLDWVASLGGGVVGTLPLLAFFPEPLFDPSPYAPVSRLFWSELFLDPARVPGLESCAAARELLESHELGREIEALRRAPLVEYQRLLRLKRRVLQELACRFFGSDRSHDVAFQRFREQRPEIEDYARFQAVCEARRSPWPAWPEPLRSGVVQDGDYDAGAARYHIYVQWLAHRQLEALADRGRAGGARLYLDLPLGVHPHGYDVWRERRLFADAVSCGAPPDAFFVHGQDWGVPPLAPAGLRKDRYRYFIAGLRNHLRYAGLLRIDHVMGLHRLFWVPHGLEARDGVYVRYPAAELYGILSLESHRHGTGIVGEDLGTVPAEVRRAMAQHNVSRTYVAQFAFSPEAAPVLQPPPARSMASLNTHDMPTFAGFWEERDLADRQELGLLDAAGAAAERTARRRLKSALVKFLARQGLLPAPAVGAAPGSRAVLHACLAYLARGPAQCVLVSLEDLWLEAWPQNVPGTWKERPNWRRKARYSLEAMQALPEVLEPLREVDRLRRGSGA